MKTNARFPFVVIRQYVKTIKFIDQLRVLFGALQEQYMLMMLMVLLICKTDAEWRWCNS